MISSRLLPTSHPARFQLPLQLTTSKNYTESSDRGRSGLLGEMEEQQRVVKPRRAVPENPSIVFGGHDEDLLRSLGVNLPRFPPVRPEANGVRFQPLHPSDTPEILFAPEICPDNSIPAPRFVRRNYPRQLLIYTDGSCLSNGREAARAGCGFVYRPATGWKFTGVPSGWKLDTIGAVDFGLELCGPDGQPHEQTSNRAELRAVIAALRFRLWRNEGFQSLVIATDSTYVVAGATEWVKKWVRNGWRTAKGCPVKNQDLWNALLETLEKSAGDGLQVMFWQIPRELNSEADRFARKGAVMDDIEEFTDITGAMC